MDSLGRLGASIYDMVMKLSIIIPTYNRADSLKYTLSAICEQSLSTKEFEIVIVDDGSQDKTQQMVRDFMEAKSQFAWQYVRHDSNRGRSAARNSGIRAMNNEVALFIDDDIRPVAGWAEAHQMVHQAAKSPVAVTGAVIYPEDWCIRSNYIRFLNSRYLVNRSLPLISNGGLPPNWFAGGNTSVLKSLLLRAGLFDESIDRCEDGDMGCKLYKLGIPLVYEPYARTIHYSEVVWSLDRSLRIFKQFYQYDAPLVRARHQECFDTFWYWMVEPYRVGEEPWKRLFVKCAVRAISNQIMAKALCRLMQKFDDVPAMYLRSIYIYIMLCVAIDGVRKRKSSNIPLVGST